jgi:hypothetical protein
MVKQVAFELAAAVPALTLERCCRLCGSFCLTLCGGTSSLKYIFDCKGRTCKYIEKTGSNEIVSQHVILHQIFVAQNSFSCRTIFKIFPNWLNVLKADISRHNRNNSIHSKRNTTINAQLYCGDCTVQVQRVWK